MSGKIGFIADVMFIKPALPDPVHLPLHMAVTQYPSRKLAREPRLDPPSARRAIAIPLGQDDVAPNLYPA